MRLSEVIGHDRQRAALARAHVSGSAHHAYLFIGPEGVGKRGVAYGLAALSNCDDATARAEGRACGRCRHCRLILAPGEDGEPDGRHPDLWTLVPDGKQIKIAQVRELLRVVPFPPIDAAFRYVIIDPADALGPEAANALLKTLEEPSSRTRFVLVTSRPAGVLATIKSRCQRVVFGRLGDAELVAVLTTRGGLSRADAERVSVLADGSVAAAMALIDDPIMQKHEAFVRAFLSIKPGDAIAAFDFAGRVVELPKATRLTALDLIERVLRDALVLSVGAGVPLWTGRRDPRDAAGAEALARLEAWAAAMGADAILARLELIAETRRGLMTFSSAAKLTFERLLLALTAPPGREGTRPILPQVDVL